MPISCHFQHPLSIGMQAVLFHTQPSEQKCSWEQMLSPLCSTSQREEPVHCKMHPPGTKAALGKVLPRETEALVGGCTGSSL